MSVQQLNVTAGKVTGDLCRLTGKFTVEHYRCDDFPDGTVTHANGTILIDAPSGALWGFSDEDRLVTW